MSDKMKNLIVRSITGVIFVAAVVTCFLRPEAMILLFVGVYRHSKQYRERDGKPLSRHRGRRLSVLRHCGFLLRHSAFGSVHTLSADSGVYVHIGALHQSVQPD